MGIKKFVRIRGRVQGPFDEERLRILASRGQFGRIHEVSDDGYTWEKASAYPELFSPPQRDNEATKTQDSANRDGGRAVKTTPDDTGDPHSQDWYYAKDGKRQGPVDMATLRLFFSTGELSSDDVVWKESMASWTPAGQVPGLIGEGTPPNVDKSPDSEASSSHGAPGAGVAQVLRSSRPWVLFIAVVGFICAGLALVGGLLLVISGSRAGFAPVIAQGLFSMVFAVLFCLGAVMLTLHAIQIGRYLYQPEPARLRPALESLRLFWQYVGTNLIVILVLLSCLGIWVLAVGGSL